ncbi:hypothetical protein [Cetobacterium sp.]|uniref:hypothetical protein n=1 Tax=Cetobacterium sp. TaxID=2071632 RepID=UPI003F3776F3
MDLLKFINENCEFVEDDEEKEILNFMKTYDETEAKFLEVSFKLCTFQKVKVDFYEER